MRSLLLLPALIGLLSAPAVAQSAPTRRLSGVVARVGDATRPVRVVAASATRSDTTELAADGRFAVEVPRGAVGLRFEPVDTADYHPAAFDIPAGSPDVGWTFVLVPRRWLISAGRYAGTVTPIDLAAGFDRPCAECPVFFGTVGRSPSGPVFTRTSTGRPLRVAFDHTGAERIGPADSVAFWAAVDSMEGDVGMDLFEPASYASVAADPEDAVLVWADRSLGDYAGWGGIGADGQGRIRSAMVALRSLAMVRRPGGAGLVAHELVHALGFGHTCAWASVVADQRCPELRTEGLSVQDVAYLQLAAAVGEAARRIGVMRPWEPTLAAMRASAPGVEP